MKTYLPVERFGKETIDVVFGRHENLPARFAGRNATTELYRLLLLLIQYAEIRDPF